MNRAQRLLTFGSLVLALGACSSGDLSKTDSGGVTLSVTDFDGLPISLSASGSGDHAQIGSLTVNNVAVDPTGNTSNLMNVEIQSYEVTFTRADNGTRVPPKLVNYVFGIAPVVAATGVASVFGAIMNACSAGGGSSGTDRPRFFLTSSSVPRFAASSYDVDTLATLPLSSMMYICGGLVTK